MTVPSVSDQTYQYFVQEATELLQLMDDELQTLRSDFSLQKMHNLMRAAHTLKGASASVGLDTVQKTTHSLEDIFRALCHSDTVISEKIERLVLQGYRCVDLLMSAQLAGSPVDGDDILDRMAIVVAQLQQLLGDRFGQSGQLPTSNELGFDVTQSIFQLGVAQRIEALAASLQKGSRPAELRALLQTHAEVFTGLGESLGLPGFEEIARMTGFAIQQYPDLVVQIATVALADFQSAQAAVLEGDRTQGGYPSVALQQFCGVVEKKQVERKQAERKQAEQKQAEQKQAEQNKTVAEVDNTAVVCLDQEQSSAREEAGWLKRGWRKLTQPIGTATLSQKSEASEAQSKDSETLEQFQATGEDTSSTGPQQFSEASERFVDSGIPVEPAQAEPTKQRTKSTLSDLTPPALEDLDSQHNLSAVRSLTEAPKAETNASQNTSQDVVSSAKHEQNSGATIRISVEHLAQLSQTMGELLTEQNRQTLYNEQLSDLVNKLLTRVARQQQQINQQQTEQLTRQRFTLESLCLPQKDSTEAPAEAPAEAPTEAPAEALTQRPYAQFDALELERYSDVQQVLQSCLEETVQQSESAEAIELYVKRSEQALNKQKRLLSRARETLLDARMVPLETIFSQFPSMVERLKTQYQKPVEIEMEGGDSLVDKAIADKLYDPLLHLIRNAFDHGIERPEDRLSQNKPLTGKITVKGVQKGRHLMISVEDDGHGLNLEHIRNQAIASQLITAAAAEKLTPQQTVNLLFKTGFSTAVALDELSGRGIGLDVVQTKMRSLQGRITVRHEPNIKTCFTLHIPASLTIAKLLLCQAGGRTYALIADAIEHILVPTAQQVRTWEGGKMLTWQTSDQEHLVPINALSEVLHYSSPLSKYRPESRPGSSASDSSTYDTKEASFNPVVLLRHQQKLVGIEVEQLIGEQELVISPLGNTLAPPPYLYGSSVLPDGRLTLVLDGLMLAKLAANQRQHPQETKAELSASTPPVSNDKPVFIKKLILTVDDSITVRNALAEALKKHHYQVIQARDGAEALSLLKRYPEVQAILCDIEMPGMNGFEFLKVRQQMPEIAGIPTIMLTSRAGNKHRALTTELGATGYLTKPYLTPQLLKAIAVAIESQTNPAQPNPAQTHPAQPHPAQPHPAQTSLAI